MPACGCHWRVYIATGCALMTRFAQETETREFKKTLSELKEGLTSLVAMLNKHGKGELWFGIAPDGQAAGMQISEKTLRNLSQAIAAHIEPAIYPKITRRSEEHTSELQSRGHLVCRLLLEKKKKHTYQ